MNVIIIIIISMGFLLLILIEADYLIIHTFLVQ